MLSSPIGRGGSPPVDFTRFTRRLSRGDTPSEAELLELLEALRGVLVGELRRRGLWRLPPAVLGLDGHRWRAPGAGPLGDALGELVADCYVYVFVRRLPRLAAQLRVKDNVDGLIFLNVRHFVHEIQRRTDPLGYKIFRMLHDAIDRLRRAGRLRVVGGRRVLDGRTVVAFGDAERPAPAADLDRRVRIWAETLLPDLITADGRRAATLRRELADRVLALSAAGIDAFRFHDLLVPLRDEVRARWSATMAAAAGAPGGRDGVAGRTAVAAGWADGIAGRTPAAGPERGFEERAGYRALRDEIAGRIESLPARSKTRDYLSRLWRYLDAFATADAVCACGRDETASAVVDPPSRLPSHRQLGAQLKIPRARLPGLFRTLRELLRERHAPISRATG